MRGLRKGNLVRSWRCLEFALGSAELRRGATRCGVTRCVAELGVKIIEVSLRCIELRRAVERCGEPRCDAERSVASSLKQLHRFLKGELARLPDDILLNHADALARRDRGDRAEHRLMHSVFLALLLVQQGEVAL